MRTHPEDYDGGSGATHSIAHLTQAAPERSKRLYAKVTVDFNRLRACLRFVTGACPRCADERLSWSEPAGKQYGAIEVTPTLLRQLTEISENREVRGVVSISFNKNPEGGYELGEVESAPGPGDGRKEAQSGRKREKELHLFGCLVKSHLFCQFRLIFVRAYNSKDALRQFTAETGKKEKSLLITLTPKFVTNLIIVMKLHLWDDQGITDWCLPIGK